MLYSTSYMQPNVQTILMHIQLVWQHWFFVNWWLLVSSGSYKSSTTDPWHPANNVRRNVKGILQLL